jgi:radical SAM superfamily enzyme YgiQ (UPF0313 family)
MINGSFVFGLDDDDEDVFSRTVEWGVQNSITTSTYHILTPYPGTQLHTEMQQQGRILTSNWDLYDTRHVVYKTKRLSADQLEAGYHRAYRDFYTWKNIFRGSVKHESLKHVAKHFLYAGGWKKFEALWNLVIKTHQLAHMLPMLESILSKVNYRQTKKSTIKSNLNYGQPILPVRTIQ